ncbi:UNVERIFIED_CONTAM: hypothetical protein FKN15_034947 [Acipenser sinensis]
MSTNGRFAGGSFRFDVIDGNGIHPLNDSYAATCGFTYSFNLPGDLIFRASFLACHVQSMNDVSYVLQYRFVRMDSLGRETLYPFSLSYSTESPWNPREVVCEENYMEVSVRKNVPVIVQEGLAKEDWEAALSIAQEAVMSVWQVVFHQTGMTPKTMNAADARTEGYFINSTTSRVVFRSPYGMPKSEVVMVKSMVEVDLQVQCKQVGLEEPVRCEARPGLCSNALLYPQVAGIPVEAIRATVFYKQRWMLLLVDTSAACAKNPSVFDGTYLSWVTPRLLSPLVLHPTKFVDKQIKMGVEGRPLDEITATSRGYQLQVNSTVVKISIPFGAVGGYRKAQEAVMSVWQVVFHQTGMTPKTMNAADARTEGYFINSTTSRVLFRSPYGMPKSEVVMVKSMVEVDLQVQCKRVGLEEPVRCEARPGLCSNALLYPQVAGIPVEAIRATVFYKQRWMLLLVDTSAACAKNPSVFDGTYLSWVTPRLLSPLVLHPTKFVDKQIKMGVEGRPLDEITATSRGYQLLVNSTAVKISIPFGAVGGYRKSHVIDNKYNQMYAIDLFLEHQWADDLWEVTQHRSFKPVRSPYLPETPYVVNNPVHSRRREIYKYSLSDSSMLLSKDITLRGLIGKVVLILRDMKSLKEEDRFEQRCPFPTNEMLVCMPNGVMSVLVVPMAPVPPVNLARTTLLDQNCRPTEATSDRALFTFRVNTCGTRSKNYLVYENEVIYSRELFPANAPVITRDSEYSCLVTGDSYRTLFHPVPARTSPHLQRLEVQAQQSSKDPAFWRQVYFHCMAVVCDPNLEDTCNKTCVPGEKRSARSVDRYSQIRGYASAGPVQLVPEGGVVDLKTAGNFVTECRDRYFWMSTNGRFAGGSFRFDVIDGNGILPLNDSYAATCGFTYSFNLPGDLIFRASFLACHNDVSYVLQYRFVRMDSLGRETVYPFSLSCSTESPWNPREVVCEENYMEVSVRKNVPVIAQEGLAKEDWEAALSIAQEAVMSVWQGVFHQTGMTPKTMNAADARTEGYFINSTTSRVLFRSPYGMAKSEVVMVAGIPVEAIRATVFYKQRWMLLLVDTSAACAKNPSVFDGTYLSWVTPRLLFPLVLHPTKFVDKQIKMGVEGRPLDEITATSRGYQLLVNSTAVKISIPFGAVGGYRKSHVIDNKYNQMYAIDLFLEHQWADDLWEVTQHRSFKPVRSPYLPETPYVVNNTIPSEKGFTVTLGNFKPDVELKNLTINGVPLTLHEAENRGVKITEVKHPNGTKNFVLKVPFAHPLIPEQYIGDNYRRYLLNINYTLNIIPVNEPYFHPATIMCDVQDVGNFLDLVRVHPDVKGICTNTSIVFEVTPGNMDYQWELCIGEEPLTPELVARRGYTMTSQPKIRVELPLFSIGYIYEDITLRGLIGKVVLILRDMKSLKEEDRFEQRCPFPTNEMLVCMPNGVMSVLVVPMAPVPPVNLARTTLLDQNCRPSEATSDRALFTFRVNTCGTRSKIDKNYLVYENEVIYSRELFPANAPVITRDSEYRVAWLCVFLPAGVVAQDVSDGNGIHPLNDSYAATCGFTYSFNLPGDLIFRASFLACHNDVSYVLQYRFVRMDSLGRETVYPFSLSCSTESPWIPGFTMSLTSHSIPVTSSWQNQVSVRKNVPVIAQEGLAKEDWEAALSIAQEAVMSVWQVVFHQTGMTPKTMNAADAHPSVFDGTYLSWVTPRLLSPLVLHPTKFLDKQIKMGVEGRPLDEITATSRGYQLLVNSTAVKISIPFGAVGGYRKSHVIDNKYNQMYAIDLFLEHQWADDLWEVTQHRSFKPVRSPYLPETPYVVNNTIPSEKGFTVTLVNFKPDVELKNLTINGVPLTLPEAENRGVKITEVKHPNGTKNFVLKVPFAHPLIPEQYIGDNYRRYLLNINYTLNIIPVNEPYFHPATIVCDVQDVVHPDVKGICTNTSIVFEVTPGNMDYQWELCIGEEPLTPELVARRGYTMTSQPKIRVELPLFSIGYIYEDITLRGLIGKVVLILRDMKSLKEEDRFEQRCPFPTNEMLVCMPNGVMSVLVVPMAPVPPVNLARTTLLDQNCRPSEATSDRALFTFRVNTCGTRSKIDKNYLVYENEVIYSRELFPANAPVITRDSEYRLTIRCRYPVSDSRKIFAERKLVPAPGSFTAKGEGTLQLQSAYYSGDKRSRDVLNLKARLARDVSYSQFYSAFPVSQSLLEPLFLQVELLNPHSLADRLFLQDCWATLTPELDASQARSVDRYSQIRGYASAGPVQLVPEGGVVDLKTAAVARTPPRYLPNIPGVTSPNTGEDKPQTPSHETNHVDKTSADKESFLRTETQDPDMTQVTAPSSELASDPEIPAPSSSERAATLSSMEGAETVGFPQVRRSWGAEDCVVCLSSPVSTVLTCGHACMCVPCADNVWDRIGTCPLCRKLIAEITIIGSKSERSQLELEGALKTAWFASPVP